MTALMNFDFNNNQVRVLTINKEPWFTTKDIATVLNYKDPSMMTKHVDKEDKQTINPQKLDTVNATQSFSANTFKISVINESGLYACIFGSTKPVARVFKKWVTSEVLPEIRKTGSYNGELYRKYQLALNEVKTASEDKRLAEETADYYKSCLDKAETTIETYQAILSTEASLDIEQIARSLAIPNFGRNKLLAYLRRKNFIRTKPCTLPFQHRVSSGLAVVETVMVGNQAKQKARLTFQGLTWLIKQLKKDKYLVETDPQSMLDSFN